VLLAFFRVFRPQNANTVIAGIRIRNYKGIKGTPRIDLSPFHVLVGPNSSGKTTFLDAIEFIKACIIEGPTSAVERRAPEFRDLTFLRRGGPIELEVALCFPDSQQQANNSLRYKLVLTYDKKAGIRVAHEILEQLSDGATRARSVRLLGKTSTGRDFYTREKSTSKDSFQFGPQKLALSLTPPDQQMYPTGNLVKDFLSRGVRYVQLNSVAMRQPVQATRSAELDLDGTNLARVVGDLLHGKSDSTERSSGRAAVERWTRHLRYALEDLETISWAKREPDNAEYLILSFAGGLKCPMWLVSDGVLRMLALTLPAFLPINSPSVYMVEEPENGVHPHALEIILKALNAIPASQVFIATHSPLVVQQVGPNPLLCFTRDPETGIHVIHGKDHSALKDWQGTPDLSSIFASRVLG
jgi:predicted ATPase